MEVDPAGLDPELRMARLYALASAAFGLMSLCLAIVPACGGVTSLLGMLLGYISLKNENSKTAFAGVVVSILGFLITVVYFLFVLLFRK